MVVVACSNGIIDYSKPLAKEQVGGGNGVINYSKPLAKEQVGLGGGRFLFDMMPTTSEIPDMCWRRSSTMSGCRYYGEHRTRENPFELFHAAPGWETGQRHSQRDSRIAIPVTQKG